MSLGELHDVLGKLLPFAHKRLEAHRVAVEEEDYRAALEDCGDDCAAEFNELSWREVVEDTMCYF